jgi:hypothetical protein
MDADELHWPMSCPFCGNWPTMVPAGTRPNMLVMQCQVCGANGPPKMLPMDAAKAWDQAQFRRRMTDRDLDGPPDDDPEPAPKPVTPKLPVVA